MRILSARSIPAPAFNTGGFVSILIALIRFLLNLIGFLPSTDELIP